MSNNLSYCRGDYQQSLINMDPTNGSKVLALKHKLQGNLLHGIVIWFVPREEIYSNGVHYKGLFFFLFINKNFYCITKWFDSVSFYTKEFAKNLSGNKLDM